MAYRSKIVPHLWFDREANEAAAFYASVFPGGRVAHTMVLHDRPSGDCDLVSFEILGQDFMAISAGPLFRPNPSISFIVACDRKDQVDALWEKLGEGGQALMPLDTYPFSPRYGWMQDRYGLSWQLMLPPAEGVRRSALMPSLMFVGTNCGKAEEAIAYYTSVFGNAKIGQLARYGADRAPDREGTLMYADFMLAGQWFAAMDSAHPHDFAFNEAVSLLVRCDTQAEIDHYWTRLSAVPEAEQCGWLKDRYGVSWQISAAAMEEMLHEGSARQIARVIQAFLGMKKFDLDALRKVYAAAD